MVIREIQIKNFRSIRNLTISAKRLNVIVGLNDVGKSNILRALNLFFNGQTDNGRLYDFDYDFAYHFPAKSKKTKEIVIVVKFEVPDTFKHSGIVTWTKSWRRSGAVLDEVRDANGNELPSYSRIPLALRNIRYRYVPAVKSKEFYKELLVDLYQTLSQSISIPLQESTEQFADSIKSNTDRLTKGLWESLSIKSVLTVPSNLQEFFKSLVFETQNSDDDFQVPLDLRGDGIQSRHIPQILKFMAEEDQNTRTKGSPRVYTIWGYEEPENGLEISKAFEMAKEFIKISEEIQLFITTHSPAFYIEAQKCTIASVNYIKKEASGETRFVDKPNISFMNEELGIMPIVAPYIQEKVREIAKYKKIIKENFLTDINTIAVEGVTDKNYIIQAIKLYSPALQSMLNSNKLRVLANQECGGCQQVVNWGKAWCHSGFINRICLLLDTDEAGSKAKGSLMQDQAVAAKCSKHDMKILQLPKPSFAKELAKRRIVIPITIENLIHGSMWEKGLENGWLSKRSQEQLKAIMMPATPVNKSLMDFQEEILTQIDIVPALFTHTVRNESKQIFCESAILESDENPDIFKDFEPLINSIETFFGIL